MTTGEDFTFFIKNLNVPVLDIGNKIGHTDYIDFIEPGNVSHPIMKGIDSYSRPFVTIKAVGILEDGGKIELFQTFFQRYTRETGLWMGCGHHGYHLFATEGGMRESHFTALKDLIDGKTISTKGFYRNDDREVTHIELSEK